MDKYIVEGNTPLSGSIKISGAKNSALIIMPATLLLNSKVCLHNVPNLQDIRTMIKVLASLGAEIEHDKETGTVCIDPSSVNKTAAPYDLVKTMRASFVVMGPLLARFGKAEVPMPGGCAIGARPVDLHLKVFKAMGASVTTEHGNVFASAQKMKGATVYLDFPSVGATENMIMAACLAEGTSIVKNAAREPEIEDLANFLNLCGARIEGAGTDTIKIEGVSSLSACDYTVMADRVEAGTFALLSCITRCPLELVNAPVAGMESFLNTLVECGNQFEELPDRLLIKPAEHPVGVQVTTRPHPGFPTDLQAPMMSYLATVPDMSVITETVFENRFLYVPELGRMGADINLEGNRALVKGVSKLSGAPIMACDIRAGAALVVASLAAQGRSEIQRIYHTDRGYERLEEKLRGIGARIERVKA
jgi:UDP-N-acetylglucosamine 1-carboxyvinyltransferase